MFNSIRRKKKILTTTYDSKRNGVKCWKPKENENKNLQSLKCIFEVAIVNRHSGHFTSIYLYNFRASLCALCAVRCDVVNYCLWTVKWMRFLNRSILQIPTWLFGIINTHRKIICCINERHQNNLELSAFVYNRPGEKPNGCDWVIDRRRKKNLIERIRVLNVLFTQNFNWKMNHRHGFPSQQLNQLCCWCCWFERKNEEFLEKYLAHPPHD